MSKQPKYTNPPAPHRLAHSIADVAKIASIGRSLLYQQIAEGRLRVRKVGRRSLVFDADLKAWLAALPDKTSS
jgi:excisionase family DNA binding protein